MFFNKMSDVLLIIDCCSSGSAVSEQGEGMVEGVFSAGVGGRTPISGQHSFTVKLIERLKKPECFTNGITAYGLYHELSRDFKLSTDGSKRQGVSPQYLRLAEKRGEFRTIRLARQPSFETAVNKSIFSGSSARKPRSKSCTTVRSTATLQIPDMSQGEEGTADSEVASPSSSQPLVLQRTAGSDGCSIRHSLFRGGDYVSEPDLWLGEENLQYETKGPSSAEVQQGGLRRQVPFSTTPALAEVAASLDFSRLYTARSVQTPPATSSGRHPLRRRTEGGLEIQGKGGDETGEATEPHQLAQAYDEPLSIFPSSSPTVADIPQNQRLMADLLRRSLTPLPALKFDPGSFSYGNAMKSTKEANEEIWTEKSTNLIFNADKGVSAARRVFLELRSIRNANVPFISAAPLNDSLDVVLASIEGPPDTPYEGGIFWISAEFSATNANQPPILRFQTRIYHPNIDCNGNICADYQQRWNVQICSGT